MKRRSPLASRTVAGVRFNCERPGHWISEGGRYGIYQMLAGTSSEQWEVYDGLDVDTDEPPYMGEMIAGALTFGEACVQFEKEMAARSSK